MKSKEKHQYPNNFRGLFGFSMSFFGVAYTATVLGVFMLFLTDYSGLDAIIGQVGYAAVFGTSFLLVTRIIDAIDDPLQGWIMDSAKERRFGKYRLFGLFGTFLIAIGTIMLFAIPFAVKSNGIFLWIWCLLGYILFDMGSAMNISMPILQKTTNNPVLRTKILSFVRFFAVIAAMPASFFAAIVEAVKDESGDLGSAATKTVILLTFLCCGLTLLGILLLKEPYHAATEKETPSKGIAFKEIVRMFKSNKPLWAHGLGFFVGNMSYAIGSAVMVYFLKWYFTANAATGEVNADAFAGIVGIYGIIALIPNFICPFLMPLVLKIAGTVDRAMRGCMLAIGIGYLSLFILAIAGVLQKNSWLFFILMFAVMLPAGCSAIAQMILNTECADYAEYKTRKNMSAICNSIFNVVGKSQAAIGGVIPGILLIAVGYSVDAATGAYAGDLSVFPQMVNGLVIVTTLIPGLMAVCAWFVYRFGYRITPQLRGEISDELTRRHQEADI